MFLRHQENGFLFFEIRIFYRSTVRSQYECCFFIKNTPTKALLTFLLSSFQHIKNNACHHRTIFNKGSTDHAEIFQFMIAA